ncbi:MAG: hypothetical protein PHO94_05610 [Petrimonas sp.]|nr:hypothetical protein [Petrimonas sp.]
MGFLKFIILTLAFYFIFKLISNFIRGKVSGTQRNRSYGETSQPQEPETQEERILDYQKKSFESADAEDVDFEEIKDTKSN